MKSKIFLNAVVSIALGVVSFAAVAQEDIQALADRWTAAYNSFDGGALADLYTDNAHLYVHGSPMLIGKEVIQGFWEDDFQVESPMTVLTVTHSVEGYDMMLVHGNYQVVDRNSGALLGSGRFAHIWHDVGGDWKLDQDLWNQPYE
jgi:uncharacterized protein (TIGR02246 family)